MKPAFAIGGGLMAVAVAAFLAGRLFAAVSISKPAVPTAEVHPDLSSDADRRTPTRFEPDQITRASFEANYEGIKAASPEELRSWVNQLRNIPVTPQRIAAFNSFFGILINIDPEQTRNLILGLRETERWAVVRDLSSVAPPRAIETLIELRKECDPREKPMTKLEDLMNWWGQNDPDALRRYIEEHPGPETDIYFPTLMRNWAVYDPAAAHAWMMEQLERRPIPTGTREGNSVWFTEEESDWKRAAEPMLQRWLTGLFENDHEAAQRFILEYNGGEQLTDAVSNITRDLLIESPDKAREFVFALPPERRDAALGGVAHSLRSYEEGTDELTYRSDKVAKWIMTLPREFWDNLPSPLTDWRINEASQFYEWLGDLPPDIQSAVVPYVEILPADLMEADFQKLMNLPNAALREQLLEQTMREVTSSKERAAVVAALDKTPFAADQKARLLSLIPPQEEESTSDGDEASDER